MKQEMSDYMNAMTSSDLETLEKIISLQYRKFVKFYKLVKDYSGLISKVKYEFNSPSSLDVVLTFNTKRNLENIKKELESSMEKNSYDGIVESVKKGLFISIKLDEG